jgi:hypothetical protein
MDYTITLTEAENLALQYVALDPQDWIENAAQNRTRIAIDEICDLYVKHKLDNNLPITVTNKPDMVLAAFNEGIVKTSQQKQSEYNTVAQNLANTNQSSEQPPVTEESTETSEEPTETPEEPEVTPEPTVTEETPTEEPTLVRARNEDGTFIPDDPSTPDVNEAWVAPEPTEEL